MLRLKKIEGRMDDIFELEGMNGDVVSVFPDFISRVVLYVPNIKNYRVVQETPQKVVFYLDNISAKNKNLIKKEFSALAKKMNFRMPDVSFEKYQPDFSRKMKRVERIKK
jgi:phenylacetate-coenzyme A ligase PaaK-like adenylate-forming protein